MNELSTKDRWAPGWGFLPATIDKPAGTDICVIIVAVPSDCGTVGHFFAGGLYSILP